MSVETTKHKGKMVTIEVSEEEQTNIIAKRELRAKIPHWVIVSKEIHEMVEYKEYFAHTGKKKDGTYKEILDENGERIVIPTHKINLKKLCDRLNETDPEYEFKWDWNGGFFEEHNDRPTIPNA